ncbi:epoxide hydrolase [Parasphingopyxis algicola]|uniref:epoxide hydrolase family protein n=1 Tax=Parasphingopyxis algicola TaxID=2026624 RepID=UPI0015A390B6|nr:epoxide hydrolase family protein [Parasphingopyxis algicola]QLC26937.1 epoxide hydrolase [Parasphingopyxis algicola]
MTAEIRDFAIDVPQSALDDLSDRLARTRFPEKETVDDWDQGIPLAYVEELVGYWRDRYDWRRCEAALNAHPNHLVEIDGVDIHFLHIRSPEADARPLLLTHGWPGSVVEFLDCIGPLSDPVAHGGKAEDAFHLVIPSLPGYGFSGKPAETGWSVEKIAESWHALMTALGYDAWYAQGGDWGAMVTSAIGAQNRGGCKGIHLNMIVAAPPPEVMENPTEEEQQALARLALYRDKGAGYSKQQSTKPQTLGYALADSPVGQMAWIVEKFHDWSDCDGHPENVFSRDRLLDNVMLYWLNNAGASSGRLYWHSFAGPNLDPVATPTGCSLFPHEIMRASRRWAETRFKKIVYFESVERGGHFAAMERPEAFVGEVRAAFRAMD